MFAFLAVSYNPYIPWDLSFFQEAIYSLRNFIGFFVILFGLRIFINLLNSIG